MTNLSANAVQQCEFHLEYFFLLCSKVGFAVNIVLVKNDWPTVDCSELHNGTTNGSSIYFSWRIA